MIVDDELHIREVVRFALEKDGFATIEADNGREALELFNAKNPDLIILDIKMPEMDGIETCRILRSKSKTPIVFLSSKDEEIDRIIGLEIGGDDYISKPFSPRELTARVRAVLRRASDSDWPQAKGESGSNPVETLDHGRLSLDPEAFIARWEQHEVVLTVTEFGVLRTLIARPGKVFSRDRLMDGAYGVNHYVSDRTIDSHVRRVRNKFTQLGADPIETVHGVGYKLGPC